MPGALLAVAGAGRRRGGPLGLCATIALACSACAFSVLSNAHGAGAAGFATAAGWNSSTLDTGTIDIDPQTSGYYIGTSYFCAGPTELNYTNASGAGVQYTRATLFQGYAGSPDDIKFSLIASPPTTNMMWVDADSGSFVIWPTSSAGTYKASLVATDSSGANTTVKNWDFETNARVR